MQAPTIAKNETVVKRMCLIIAPRASLLETSVVGLFKVAGRVPERGFLHFAESKFEVDSAELDLDSGIANSNQL
jgi:hypothetical protein